MSVAMEPVKDMLGSVPDSRTINKLFMDSPLIVIAISLIYLVVINVILPRVMANRKAFDTTNLSLALNTYLFSTACYFFYKCISIGWFTSIKWSCEPIDRSDSDAANEVIDGKISAIIR